MLTRWARLPAHVAATSRQPTSLPACLPSAHPPPAWPARLARLPTLPDCPILAARFLLVRLQIHYDSELQGLVLTFRSTYGNLDGWVRVPAGGMLGLNAEVHCAAAGQ